MKKGDKIQHSTGRSAMISRNPRPGGASFMVIFDGTHSEQSRPRSEFRMSDGSPIPADPKGLASHMLPEGGQPRAGERPADWPKVVCGTTKVEGSFRYVKDTLAVDKAGLRAAGLTPGDPVTLVELEQTVAGLWADVQKLDDLVARMRVRQMIRNEFAAMAAGEQADLKALELEVKRLAAIADKAIRAAQAGATL